jgi:NAD(P)-dependent dehydrogenase (short-subunit alcohol dehydrogenase family)
MMNRTVGRGVAGAPSEIAETVVWLSSDRASLVCGESVIVDGGTACR